MKYTVTWFRFPNGKETDEMVANSRTYATFDQALRFLQGRVRLISSRHWAGGYIEEYDSPCRIVYEIDWEGNEEDLRCENVTEIVSESEQETIPEGQRPDEDWLAYMERVNPEMFESLKYLAESASVSKSEQEEIQQQAEEISEDVENVIEDIVNGLAHSFDQIAKTLIPIFSAICKKYMLEEEPEDIRPPPKRIDSE